jgi:peptide/nickel transport system permease protein
LRFADIIQSFPIFVLGMALVGVFGPNMLNLMIAIAFLNTLVYLRLTYNEALVIREKSFIEAAKCCGVSEIQILFRHVLPNSVRAVLTLISVRFGSMVLLTAGLSFIGAGVRPPTAEWGAMIAEGAQNIFTGEWWIAIFPGIAIVIVVTGFALLGEGLRKFFDPQLRDL